jgi:hypothetical protein
LAEAPMTAQPQPRDLVDMAFAAELDHWRKLWRAEPRLYAKRLRNCMTTILKQEGGGPHHGKTRTTKDRPTHRNAGVAG